MSFRSAASLLVLAFAAGCSSREAKEDRAVIAAIDALREAPKDDLAQRRSLIEALEKLPVTTPLARDARDACVKSYRLLVEGKEGTAKLKRALDETGQAPKDALADLATAADKIKQAEEAMPMCNQAAGDLSLSRR